jgi:hypothetical protein
VKRRDQRTGISQCRIATREFRETDERRLTVSGVRLAIPLPPTVPPSHPFPRAENRPALSLFSNETCRLTRLIGIVGFTEAEEWKVLGSNFNITGMVALDRGVRTTSLSLVQVPSCIRGYKYVISRFQT